MFYKDTVYLVCLICTKTKPKTAVSLLEKHLYHHDFDFNPIAHAYLKSNMVLLESRRVTTLHSHILQDYKYVWKHMFQILYICLHLPALLVWLLKHSLGKMV